LTALRPLFLSLLLLASPFIAAGQEIEISPPAPDAMTSLTVDVFGRWPDSCVPHDPKVEIESGNVIITLDATVPPGFGCLLAVTDYRERVRVGTLAPGVYAVVVMFNGENGTHEVARAPLTVRDSSIRVLPVAGNADNPAPVFVLLDSTLFLSLQSPPAVTFDGVAATAVSMSGGRMIRATPPPHAAGTVDVAVTPPNGATRTARFAFTYFDPAAAVDPALFEPVLFPIVYEGGGGHGSRWTTENVMRVDEGRVPPVFQRPLEVKQSTCDGSGQGFCTHVLATSSVPAGAILWIARGSLEDLSDGLSMNRFTPPRFSSRIRETTRPRKQDSEVPVVREDAFARGPIDLVNVDHGAGKRVIVRVYSLDPGTILISPGGVATLQPAGNGLWFAARDITSTLPADPLAKVSVRVSGDDFQRLWALAGTTDNETQHVAVNWPR
jgi:hypothetical protein